jgi:hypothetical protein
MQFSPRDLKNAESASVKKYSRYYVNPTSSAEIQSLRATCLFEVKLGLFRPYLARQSFSDLEFATWIARDKVLHTALQ